MIIKTIELKSGIIIKDDRNLGCGIFIENKNTKFINLCYSPKNGFYLSIKGFWLTEEKLSDYLEELDMMRLSLLEAKERIF